MATSNDMEREQKVQRVLRAAEIGLVNPSSIKAQYRVYDEQCKGAYSNPNPQHQRLVMGMRDVYGTVLERLTA